MQEITYEDQTLSKHADAIESSVERLGYFLREHAIRRDRDGRQVPLVRHQDRRRTQGSTGHGIDSCMLRRANQNDSHDWKRRQQSRRTKTSEAQLPCPQPVVTCCQVLWDERNFVTDVARMGEHLDLVILLNTDRDHVVEAPFRRNVIGVDTINVCKR